MPNIFKTPTNINGQKSECRKVISVLLTNIFKPRATFHSRPNKAIAAKPQACWTERLEVYLIADEFNI